MSEHRIPLHYRTVLLRLRVDGVLERFTPSTEIAPVAENGQFQRFQSNVARMLFVPMAIERLNVDMIKTDTHRDRQF
jgi:hypothetical protein